MKVFNINKNNDDANAKEHRKSGSNSHESVFIDQITGIYNQYFFFESGKQLLQLAQRNKIPLSISIIGIDDFKIINDQYGDIVSDKILKWVVKTIKNKCRKSDLLGRLGEEEFGLLLYNTSAINAQLFLDSIRRAIEMDTYIFNEEEIKVTLSMGISMYNQVDGDMIDPVYNRAGTALYRASAGGKNCVVTY